MTISVTAKGQDTFEVIVTTQSTTNHLVTVSDAIHIKLTNGKISKETLLESHLSSSWQGNPPPQFCHSSRSR